MDQKSGITTASTQGTMKVPKVQNYAAAELQITAEQLIKDPYVKCAEVRLTAFEMAGTLARTTGHGNFKRDPIKNAHNNAV